MQKKNNKISHRSNQRQRLNRKMVLILGASFTGCFLIAILIFFKTSRVDNSMAAGSTFMVTEEAPVTDMTLEAPLLKPNQELVPNVLMVRAIKEEQKSSTGLNK